MFSQDLRFFILVRNQQNRRIKQLENKIIQLENDDERVEKILLKILNGYPHNYTIPETQQHTEMYNKIKEKLNKKI
jgi:uncharacterized membrane protein